MIYFLMIMKKILILDVSTRKQGNTSSLIRQFVDLYPNLKIPIDFANKDFIRNKGLLQKSYNLVYKLTTRD